MNPTPYTVLDLIERLKEEHAKLGNHPSVIVAFSPHYDEVTARVPANAVPNIVIPIPVYE